MKKSLLTFISFTLILLAFSWQNGLGQTYHALSGGNLTQDWSNTDLITVNDDWSGVASIRGFRGDNWTAATGIDPQTVITDASPTLDINANQTDPSVYSTGGVTEFHLTDPVVGLAGSGTADAPCLALYINSTGYSNIKIKYDLRDIDGSVDDAVQAVALQYRIGETGDFINIPGGFVADASTGPSLATLVTHVDVQLPSACNNQAQLQIRIITTNAGGNDEYIGIDNIFVGVDASAPVATFIPADVATGVAINVIPTITFDEAIFKTDGSAVTNADLAALITFKETNASGTPVSFTGTIDATKKIITITPSANLKNSQVYYLAINPVEDAAGNESVLKSVTFTTISASTPTITVVYPNGGEILYSGDIATITWTTTNFAPGENVKIEVYLPEAVWYILEASTPNDGSQAVNVGPRADYGTVYKIRISGVTNGASDESDNPFTVIATTTTLDSLKTYYDIGSKIKYKGEAVVTFIRTANRNQKYIQDARGGLLIDDASGVLTTPLAIGDKITNLEGTLGTFTGMYQLVPNVSTVTVVSTGNTVTVPTLTIPEYTANQAQYESMLIKIAGLTFPAADGSATFAASTQYTVTDGTNNLAFFTFKAGEGNPAIVGTVIPAGTYTITGLALKFNTTIEISSRSTNDFELLTGIDRTSARQVRLYPVPATEVLNVSGIQNLKSVEILDLAGKVIRTINTSTDEVIRIPVSNLKRGAYILRFNTTEGTVIKRFIR